MKSSILTLLITSILGSILFSCNDKWDLPPTLEENLILTAEGYPELSTFLEATRQSGLIFPLAQQGPFTVFAPSNEAFANSQIDFDLVDSDSLAQILLYHVIPNRYLKSLFSNDSIPSYFENQYIRIQSNDGKILLNGTTSLSTPNIEASNGMIHIIDRLLLPR